MDQSQTNVSNFHRDLPPVQTDIMNGLSGNFEDHHHQFFADHGHEYFQSEKWNHFTDKKMLQKINENQDIQLHVSMNGCAEDYNIQNVCHVILLEKNPDDENALRGPSSQCVLTKHVLIQIRQRPFMCAICGLVFGQCDELQDHVMEEHGPLDCEILKGVGTVSRYQKKLSKHTQTDQGMVMGQTKVETKTKCTLTDVTKVESVGTLTEEVTVPRKEVEAKASEVGLRVQKRLWYCMDEKDNEEDGDMNFEGSVKRGFKRRIERHNINNNEILRKKQKKNQEQGAPDGYNTEQTLNRAINHGTQKVDGPQRRSTRHTKSFKEIKQDENKMWEKLLNSSRKGFVGPKLMFPCDFCSAYFQKSQRTFKHMRKCHPNEYYFCNNCNKKFSVRSKDKFKDHLWKHLEQSYQYRRCDLCLMWFTKIDQLYSHVKQHHPEAYQECMNEKEILINRHLHQRMVDNECSDCDKSFFSKNELETHTQIFHPERFITTVYCNICNKGFASEESLNVHKLFIHANECSLQCKHCDNVFSTNEQLQAHLILHKVEKPFICSFCSASFTHHVAKDLHEKTHKTQEKFTCAACGKGFSSYEHVELHSMIHTCTRSFTCQKCGNSFKTLSALKAHEDIESPKQTVGKNFKCMYCNARFSEKGSGRKHLEKFHGVNSLDAGSKLKKNGEQHLIRLHGDDDKEGKGEGLLEIDNSKSFKCLHCNKTFVDKVYGRKHLRKIHGVNMLDGRTCSGKNEKIPLVSLHKEGHKEEEEEDGESPNEESANESSEDEESEDEEDSSDLLHAITKIQEEMKMIDY